jgi:hypothetical protein
LCDISIDGIDDDVMEVHYTSLGLSYTSDDLVRRGPSGRMCIEDDERLAASIPVRVREDLFQEMPPLIDITVNDEDGVQLLEPEVECIPPPLCNIAILEDSDSDVEIIEPDIIYLKTVVNIDFSNE